MAVFSPSGELSYVARWSLQLSSVELQAELATSAISRLEDVEIGGVPKSRITRMYPNLQRLMMRLVRLHCKRIRVLRVTDRHAGCLVRRTNMVRMRFRHLPHVCLQISCQCRPQRGHDDIFESLKKWAAQVISKNGSTLQEFCWQDYMREEIYEPLQRCKLRAVRFWDRHLEKEIQSLVDHNLQHLQSVSLPSSSSLKQALGTFHRAV